MRYFSSVFILRSPFVSLLQAKSTMVLIFLGPASLQVNKLNDNRCLGDRFFFRKLPIGFRPRDKAAMAMLVGKTTLFSQNFHEKKRLVPSGKKHFCSCQHTRRLYVNCKPSIRKIFLISRWGKLNRVHLCQCHVPIF